MIENPDYTVWYDVVLRWRCALISIYGQASLSRLVCHLDGHIRRTIHYITNDLDDLRGKPGHAPWLTAQTNLVVVAERVCAVYNSDGHITWCLSNQQAEQTTRSGMRCRPHRMIQLLPR